MEWFVAVKLRGNAEALVREVGKMPTTKLLILVGGGVLIALILNPEILTLLLGS